MTAPDCPFPSNCPVPAPSPAQIAGLRLTCLSPGTEFYRVYEVRFGYDGFNPGAGDTRFAPVTSAGMRIPTLYGGEDEAVALLESVFHDVHQRSSDRIIYSSHLRARGLVHLRTPVEIFLVDLRDEALSTIGLTRDALLSTSAAHYTCTRQWAEALYAATFTEGPAAGLLWHSRQAELLAPAVQREAFVLFGTRAPSGAGDYPLNGPGVRNLLEGGGRVLVEQIAERLNARVESDE